ncbi:hypothetical protein ACFX14_033935 [Malus domestica]
MVPLHHPSHRTSPTTLPTAPAPPPHPGSLPTYPDERPPTLPGPPTFSLRDKERVAVTHPQPPNNHPPDSSAGPPPPLPPLTSPPHQINDRQPRLILRRSPRLAERSEKTQVPLKVLTAKSGEEDCRDTSYMLRKASPSMGIKYTNVEEPSNISLNKRHVQALSRSERHKQMKVTESDACVHYNKYELWVQNKGHN